MMQREFKTALTMSLLLHLGFVVILVISNFAPSPSLKPTPVTVAASSEPAAPIEAVAIDQQQYEQRVQQLRDQREQAQRAEQQRIADLERRARAAEQARAEEEQRIRRLEQQRRQQDEAARQASAAAAEARRQQQQEAERARQAEQQRQQAEAEARAAAERRRQEQEAAARAEAERQQRERDAQLRAQQERELQERLEREAQARQAARQRQTVSEVERFTAMIRDRIQQNFRQDERMRGRQCRINIRLASNGFVTNVSVLDGDQLVCDAALRAVERAGNLPVSQDPAVFEQLRNINLTMAPEL